MLFTNAKKFYPLYVQVRHLIFGTSMTRECMLDTVELIGGNDHSKEISLGKLQEEFNIIE